MTLKQVTRTQIAGIAMVCVLLVGGVAMGTTVLAQDSQTTESEPNDSFSDADSVQLGATFSGTITEDDRDTILVEGIEPGQNVTIEATAGNGEVNVGVPDIGFVDPGTTRQGSEIVEDPPLSITVDESFDQDGVTSSDYTIRVTAAGPGGTPTEEPTEETTTEAPTEEPTEETTTEAPTEETEDGDDGKAKQPSDDDAAANGGNGKAKVGDDSSDDGDAASNGKAKAGDDGDDSDEAANSGNGKAKVGDSEETTTETETDTNEDTTAEADTDGETDLATDASGDLNCEDFPTKDLAQQNLDNNPDDPNGLDADDDGEACDAGVDA